MQSESTRVLSIVLNLATKFSRLSRRPGRLQLSPALLHLVGMGYSATKFSSTKFSMFIVFTWSFVLNLVLNLVAHQSSLHVRLAVN
jgi:hypothetical protein